MKKHAFSTLRRLYFASTLLLLYAGIPPAKAQSPTPDSLIRYKWEIATDLLWLIDKNTVPRFSIFGRMNITTKTGKHRAWRLRLATDFSKVDSTQINNSTPTDIDQFDGFLAAGYEWQKVRKKFTYFYGTDLLFSYLSFRYETNSISRQDGFQSKIDDWSLGLVGFFGVKYFISSHFSVSTESSLSLLYNSFDRRNSSGTVMFPNGTRNSVDRNELLVRINPLYVLNISYHF